MTSIVSLPKSDHWGTSVLTLFFIFFFFSSRQKISKEGIPEVRGTIRELEAEWDRKWLDTLKDTPLVSFLNEDPVSHHWDF